MDIKCTVIYQLVQIGFFPEGTLYDSQYSVFIHRWQFQAKVEWYIVTVSLSMDKKNSKSELLWCFCGSFNLLWEFDDEKCRYYVPKIVNQCRDFKMRTIFFFYKSNMIIYYQSISKSLQNIYWNAKCSVYYETRPTVWKIHWAFRNIHCVHQI